MVPFFSGGAWSVEEFCTSPKYNFLLLMLRVTVLRVGDACGWSALGSMPLMGSGVFINSLSSWLAG